MDLDYTDDDLDAIDLELHLGDLDRIPPNPLEPVPGPERTPRPARALPDPAVRFLALAAIGGIVAGAGVPLAIAWAVQEGRTTLAWALVVGACVSYGAASWAGAAIVARHRYAVG